MNQPRIFHLLTKYLLSLKSSPLLPCRPAPPSSSTLPPLSPKTHKLHCFANCICNSPLLQSVLACTVSSGLLGCSVAPCVGHVSSGPPPPRTVHWIEDNFVFGQNSKSLLVFRNGPVRSFGTFYATFEKQNGDFLIPSVKKVDLKNRKIEKMAQNGQFLAYFGVFE